MASADILCIMNLLKEAGNEKLISANISSDVLSGRPSRTKVSKTGEVEESYLKEVPPFIMACFKVLVTNLTEREDNKRKELREEFELKLAEKDAIINDLQKKVKENYYSIDAQAQYNRSENIKIHGIPYKKDENTNEIVKDIAKYCGVEINDNDLSTSHRLMSKDEMNNQINPSNRDTKLPVIIARVNRRDLKVKLLEAKKTITANVNCPDILKNALIYEDVTPLRSRMMYHLRQRNDKKAFRYVWSKGGRIYARTPEEAALPRDQQPKPKIINTPDDLEKVGFTKEEIADIINTTRN